MCPKVKGALVVAVVAYIAYHVYRSLAHAGAAETRTNRVYASQAGQYIL